MSRKREHQPEVELAQRSIETGRSLRDGEFISQVESRPAPVPAVAARAASRAHRTCASPTRSSATQKPASLRATSLLTEQSVQASVLRRARAVSRWAAQRAGMGRFRVPCCFLACAVAWLAACDREPSGGFDHSKFDVQLLHGEVLSASPVIGEPFQLRSSGDWLFIGDAIHDPSLHLLDRRTGRLIRSFGRKGKGPGDFSSSPLLLRRPGDSSGVVWTWDMSLGRLTRIDAAAPLVRPTVVQVEHVPGAAFAGIATPWRVAWLSPDLLIGVHPSDSAHFSIFSPAGRVLRTVPGDLLGPNEASRGQRLQATMGGLGICAWPDRGYVLIYHRVGRIEYYDSEAHRVRLVDVPFPSEPFTEDEEGKPRLDNSTNYYMACVVYDDRLYAAFSGRRDSDYEGSDAASYAAEFVHVFDWDGALREVYRLDQAIYSIDIPAEGGVIYAGSLTTAAVYRFSLPK